jgi:biopolymer transport protein ExbD
VADHRMVKKAVNQQRKKVSTRVDMTPMVDLGFLLITFFILTTTLITPQTMEISVPSKKQDKNPPKLKESLAITILIGKDDAVYYYFGVPDPKVGDPDVKKTNYSKEGLEKMLLERNASVHQRVLKLEELFKNRKLSEEDFKKKASKERANSNAPMVIIKSTDQSTYKNFVDVLDEMRICNIGRYAVVDISGYDLKLLQKQGEQLTEAELELVNN